MGTHLSFWNMTMTSQKPVPSSALLILSGLSVLGLLSALFLGFFVSAQGIHADIHIGVSLVAITFALITHLMGKEGSDLLSALLLLIVIGSGLGTASGILSGTAHMIIASVALFSSVGTHLRRLSRVWS